VAESVTITDNRTGQSVDIPINEGGVSATDFSKLLPGIWFYDPGFSATAECESKITFIDGDVGILRYRGYPIEQLAEESSYLECAYLLLNGELPTAAELDTFVGEILGNTEIDDRLATRFFDGFARDAHPMGMLVSSVGALSTVYPESKQVEDPAIRYAEIRRLIAKVATLAAAGYRYSQSLPFVAPDPTLSFTENFLSMLWKGDEAHYEPDPVLAKALDILFILHADHEQNCSTTSMRVIGSSLADPYASAAGACAALYGPRHGGANEAVLKMLTEIGSLDNVEDFVASVKGGQGGRLQGFGHRVYKSYDPRARIIQKVAYDVFEVTGKNPLLDIALKLEEVALADEYFVSRRLYPNVDFYSGLIYQAMGFPTEMFTVLFAIARTTGWLAHWQEELEMKVKIARPRQLYTGSDERPYVAIAGR
jgi:citrate synthase